MSIPPSETGTRPSRQPGFTLIELLVVVAIIALLAAILFPVFSRVHENARRASCQSNLKQIGLSLLQYTQDFDERFPPAVIENTTYVSNGETITGSVAWHLLVQPYTKSTQVFACPSNKRNRTRVNGTGSTTANFVGVSYVANGHGNQTLGTSFDWGGVPPMARFFDGTPPTSFDLPGGAPLAKITAPSQVINVLENFGTSQGSYTYDYGVLASTGTVEFTDHLRMTNFLFCDGHVKAMKPIATYWPLNMWTVANTKSGTSDSYLGSALKSQEKRLDS